MRNYKSGEIIEVAFPFEEKSDKKVRPALVIRDLGESLIVAKITSKHKGREWDIELLQFAIIKTKIKEFF